MKRLLPILLLLGSLNTFAQHDKYIPTTDTAVLANISKWQDLKFGLFMHWRTYSQWGIVESWSLCPEDEGWTQRKGRCMSL